MPLTVEFADIDDATQYSEPQKLINNEADVETFSTSVAYARITAFIAFISDAMPETSLLSPPTSQSKTIEQLLALLKTCEAWMEQCPPHTGARRFGNLAFREWHVLLNNQSERLLSEIFQQSRRAALTEIVPYWTGAFGSAQRLDYGTGHELSFMAFICCLYQLGILSTNSKEDAQNIGLRVFPAYLHLIQRLVVVYTLEPAGSHGVWGLDDHFAMPYLLGAAQSSHVEPTVHPTPASITSPRDVKDWRVQNLYFDAIGFINDVKKGPFWEHSPMLYDISGIDNWAKIAVGMKKMYNVEVLGKFPVVQHFPFGPVFFPFTPQLNSRPQAVSQDEGAITDLQEVRNRTSTLHVTEYEKDRQALDADTPVPDETPTSTAKARRDMPPPSAMPPTSVPWKTQRAQIPTAAPWAGSTARHSSTNANPIVNHMSSPRTAQLNRGSVPSMTQTNATQRRPSTTSISEPVSDKSTEVLEQANTEGLEDGIGVHGLPGTKAPFVGARTIHPAVLASMQARGETPP